MPTNRGCRRPIGRLLDSREHAQQNGLGLSGNEGQAFGEQGKDWVLERPQDAVRAELLEP